MFVCYFYQILMYLRMCLAYSAGLQPDVGSTAAMQIQAPSIGRYVRQLIAEKGRETGPVTAYVDIAYQLVNALNGMLKRIIKDQGILTYLRLGAICPPICQHFFRCTIGYCILVVWCWWPGSVLQFKRRNVINMHISCRNYQARSYDRGE